MTAHGPQLEPVNLDKIVQHQPRNPQSGRAPLVALTLGEPSTITAGADRIPFVVSNDDTSDTLVIDWDGPEDPENPKK